MKKIMHIHCVPLCSVTKMSALGELVSVLLCGPTEIPFESGRQCGNRRARLQYVA
jgi:hypothetical protein